MLSAEVANGSLQNRHLYVGDVVGMRTPDGRKIGQAYQTCQQELEDIQSSEQKRYWKISGLFNVAWHATALAEQFERSSDLVQNNIFLLDRPNIPIGASVTKPGWLIVRGKVVEKVQMAIVAFESSCLNNVLMEIPVSRLTTVNYDVPNLNFLHNDIVGQLSNGIYEVTTYYSGSEDSCTMTLELPSKLANPSNTIKIGHRVSWSFKELYAGSWKVAQKSFLFRCIESLVNAGEMGIVSDIVPVSGKCSWARNIRTLALVQNVSFGGEKSPHFAMSELDIEATHNLKLTEEDLLFSIAYWEKANFGPAATIRNAIVPGLEEVFQATHGSHLVRIHSIKHKLRIRWELNEQDTHVEEVDSREVAGIVELGTAEIPERCFAVLRFPLQRSNNSVGIALAFPGELDLSPVNPSVNPSASVDVSWMEIRKEERQFTLHHSSLHPTYDLVGIPLKSILRTGILVVDPNEDNAFCGSCLGICENGQIKVVDAAGVKYERWPFQIDLHTRTTATNLVDILLEQAHNNDRKVDRHIFGTMSCPQVEALTTLSTCDLDDYVPYVAPVFEEELNNMLRNVSHSSDRRDFWAYNYENRKDLFSVVFEGQSETEYQDMAIVCHFQVPCRFPSETLTLLTGYPALEKYQCLTDAMAVRVKRFLEGIDLPVVDLFNVLEQIKGVLFATTDTVYDKVITHEGRSTPLLCLYTSGNLNTPAWIAGRKAAERVQLIQLVFCKMLPGCESRIQAHVAKHYFMVREKLMMRWSSWVSENGVSDGFKTTVQNAVLALKAMDLD